jgi:hypothetical protein|tara:strand:+ start:312 stop:488 length:177 start_codon:yes stop_codon:yes gene_type:complete
MDCKELINGIGEEANKIEGINILSESQKKTLSGGASELMPRLLIKFVLIPLEFQKYWY